MQITNIRLFPVQAPGRTFLPLIVETDGGVYGVGEAGLLRRPLAVAGALEHLKRFLIGEDPFRIEHLWQKMFRGGFYHADRTIGSVVSAVDIALWDIKGKKLGVPVFELLGGRCRDYVECYTNHSPEFIRQQLVADEATGRPDPHRHRFIRLSPDHGGLEFDAAASIRSLLTSMQAARDACGDQVEILVDVHCRFDPEEAVRFCREAERFRPYFIEDPIRAENRASYRRLRSQTSVPIAAGEHSSSKWEFKELIEEHLIDYARVDLCLAGGLTEAKKIAGWCETHYIKMVPHNPLGPISTAACVHLDFAVPNFGVQELSFQPMTMLPNVFPVQLRMEGAHFVPPTEPGLGVDIDIGEAMKHPFEFGEPPHLHRPDGSFTNW